MKPDIFMPFFGPAFVQAARAHGRAVAGSYIFVLVHYWFHEHCRGLRDDDDMLRRICECDKEEWPETKDRLFDNDQFFTLGADGLWHQKRADEEWEKSTLRIEAGKKRWENINPQERAKAARHAAKQRWKK